MHSKWIHFLIKKIQTACLLRGGGGGGQGDERGGGASLEAEMALRADSRTGVG